MTLEGTDDFTAGLNVAKNINGFDLSFNASQSFAENSAQEAKVSLSKKF